MNRRIQFAYRAAVLLVLVLASSTAHAQRFNVDLSLDASVKISVTGRTPTVHSYTSASLVDSNGSRIYNQEVILNHRIRDLTNGGDRFTAKTVTEIGYASSSSLAELDTPEAGGNGDGVIDSRDALFHELCVWVDKNRDGISQPGEIFSLDEVGIVYLAYDYKPIQLWDSFGNLFRYVSRVGMRTPLGGVTSWPTFDVIFAER